MDGVVAGSLPAAVMSGYSVRSIMCRLWLMLMLLNDALIRLVHAATLAANSAYQACLASPSTCTRMCAPPPAIPHRVYISYSKLHEK